MLLGDDIARRRNGIELTTRNGQAKMKHKSSSGRFWRFKANSKSGQVVLVGTIEKTELANVMMALNIVDHREN
ncbi:hypothetical protein VNO78_22003 [Psophocarpus tetragonolobus]|uniref:Uncharacterized protein n=1 Tax=Psophocarpus tetragonolobus TaxID=3891 RepID=A0AAN9SHD8_PSOTE